MRYLFSFFFFFNDTATTEIYTLSLHDALPIYPDRIAQLEDPAVPLPLQDHLLLVEPETVPRKRLDLHQAVDEILAQLHEEPERVHRQDEALELLPHSCGHERRLLPLDQLPFRLVGRALGARRM